MTAHRITAEEIASFRKSNASLGCLYENDADDILDALDSAYAELDRLHADGMPRDREELQKLLNDAHRKGNQEAHEAHRLTQEMGLSAQGGEVPEQAFRREDRYIVLKREDLIRYATPAQLRELERICQMIQTGRGQEGKRINSYVVVADDWPEYEETWEKIKARVTGVPAPPHPDTVEVSREEWEALLDFAERIVPIRDNLSGISWVGKLSDVFAAYDNWYALRAQPTTNETRG